MLLSINVLRSYEDHRLYYSAFSQSRHCSQQINKDLPAGLDLSVEHLTAAREVMGSISKARPKLRILMRIKVLPLPSKCLDFPMAQIQDSKLKFDFGSTCATRCKFLGVQLKILGASISNFKFQILGASISKEKVKSLTLPRLFVIFSLLLLLLSCDW